ncbi:DUF2339 domain-containing protein [uncultured Pelagimonas sp.]|uniref:DUF2339 domain-containing protein n=1 Tax=uncultured Pelagimonas sp. TaxID=1618102 RepID=UPI00262D7128|nr:DUF2339 domain-containing protein [uncultured Pelagimonas sp.]
MIDEAVLLIGLAVLTIPAGLIWLAVSHLRLRREVKMLRTAVDALGHPPAPKPFAPVATAENVVPLTQTADAPSTSSDDAPLPTPTRPPVWDRPHKDIPPKSAREPVVFKREQLDALLTWLPENWFYAVAALSLALSGIFLVQYGIETGLLSPAARVASALGFGLVLIGAGEWIRRRFGDSEASSTAYLPSVLSGAGLVTLMGGILSARMLYDMIDPGAALFALFSVAIGAMILGWFHGALLAAIGVIGGIAAPFLVGGSSDRPEWLFVYFALMVGLGLAIDTVKRWAWISVLALVCGTVAGGLLWFGETGSASLSAAYAGFAVVLVILVVLIPARGVMPDHQGACALEALYGSVIRSKTSRWPIFPARLSGVMSLTCCAILFVTAMDSSGNFWLNICLASGLTALFTVWARPAPAIQDHALAPALTLLALLGSWDTTYLVLQDLSAGLAAQDGQTETRLPMDITWALLAAIVPSVLAAWHSLKTERFATFWAAGAVLLAPLAGLALELTWQPITSIGAWPWAFHALALAVLMTLFATQFAKADAFDKTRTSLAVISALACLAFAVGVVLFDAALTLALAATVLAATLLDRRFNLPLMGVYISAGIIAIGYRLVIDPGLDWAINAPVFQMLAAYGGTTAALVAGYFVIAPMDRPRSKVFLESAALSVGGMTLSLTLFHVLDAVAGRGDHSLHWEFGLHATIFIGLVLAQVLRMELGGKMRWMRMSLAAIYALFALGTLAFGVSVVSPLFGHLLVDQSVVGLPLLNTLIPAYLIPALALGFGALRLSATRKRLRIGFATLSIAMAAYWAVLAIRHFWRGSDQMPMSFGVTQPELYSYTVALLLTGAALFYQALARQSDRLRQAGVVVIGLAVAKVFLIDISGLQGLTRVFSFLLLGLSLAGLAWLNRWVQLRTDDPDKDPDDPAPVPAPNTDPEIDRLD